MPKPGSLLSDISDQLKSLGKQTAKTVVKTPADLAKTAAKQGGFEHVEIDEKVKGRSEKTKASVKSQKDESKDIAAHLYGLDDQKPAEVPAAAQQISKDQRPPEDQAKIMQLRQQLHSQYYQQLTNRPKQQEERPAEKVERQKMEDLQEKKKKEEKKKPLSVARAQQSAEKFRGVSG